MGLALAGRIAAAVFSTGFVAADEHFQILEPAYGLVHGYFYKAWEWEQGLRSWLTPGVYAGLIRIIEASGISDPESLAAVLRLLTGIFSLIGVWAIWDLTTRLTTRNSRPEDRNLRRTAAGFLALWWGFIYFGVRTLSEPIAMNIALTAFVLALRTECCDADHKEKSGLDRADLLAFGSGLLSGLAFGVRFQTAFLGVSLGLFFVFKRDLRRLLAFSTGALIVVAALGWLDRITWGAFLHSPIAYFNYNVVQDGASVHFGSHPWHRYLIELNHFIGPALTILALGFAAYALRGLRRSWPFFLWLLPFFAVHQLIGHKELRFIIPVIPVLILLALDGFFLFLAARDVKARRRWSAAVAGLALVTWIWQAGLHTWNWNGDVTRLYAKLGRLPDLEALTVCGTTGDHTGGYFYLRRQVPFSIFPESKSCPPPEPGRTTYYVHHDAPGHFPWKPCSSMSETLDPRVYKCGGSPLGKR